jgi:hypothetical protein
MIDFCGHTGVPELNENCPVPHPSISPSVF